jgi:four helix bundle protein
LTLKFDKLKILQTAETIADGIWKQVVKWDPFLRDTVGIQLARSVDSIGSNIAEAFGRFHYGEKVQFLYYARGSLYETKYWINRSQARQLMIENQTKNYTKQLSELARQMNAFISNLKNQQQTGKSQSKTIKEISTEFVYEPPNNPLIALFSEEEIRWIETILNI